MNNTEPDDEVAPPQPMVRWRRHGGNLSIKDATVWFGISYAIAIIGYLMVNALAARLLGQTFGYFVIAITISTMLGQLGLAGVHRGGLREAARLRGGDLEGLRDLRRSVRAVSLVLLPAVGAATAATTFMVLNLDDSRARWSIAVGVGLLVWLSGQQKLWANYLRGFGQVRLAGLLEGRSGGAIASICQAILIGVVYMFFPGWGLSGAIGALAIGYAAPVTLAWSRASHVWGHVDVAGRVFRDLRAAVGQYWRFSSNLLAGYLNSTVEIWIAGLLLTGLDLSLFSAAQRLSVLLSVPLISLGVVFSPVVSRLFEHDDSRLEALLRTGATLAAAGTALAWIPMLLAPETVLMAVYGRDFIGAAPILLILTIGNIANVVTGMSGTALTMSRHEGLVAKAQWIAVVVRIGAGMTAASLFGPVALATSAATATTLLYAFLWRATRRRMGLSTHITLRPDLRLMRETSG